VDKLSETRAHCASIPKTHRASIPKTHCALVPTDRDIVERGKAVLQIEIEGITAVLERLGDAFVKAVHLLVACRGRVVVMGIGKSGLVGRKIAATLSSTGTPAFFVHPVEGAHGDMGALRSEDCVIAISNSGETPELVSLLPSITGRGVPIVSMTGGASSSLALASSVCLDTSVPREACLLGLAPTSSTTAVLALGDALALCLMEAKHFDAKDFHRHHPGGMLGQRLSLPVTELMREKYPFVSETSTQEDALRALHEGKLGALLIATKEHTLSGIVTDGDVRQALFEQRLVMDAPISAIMTQSPMVGRCEDSGAHLLNMMEASLITVLPIVDANNHILGIVHMHDMLGRGQIRFT